MSDRADYLARTLIARLASLRASFAEDGRGEPERQRRLETIEKVLAVELGITDGAMLSLVEAAIPLPRGPRAAADRDVSEFAAFLRQRLHAQLAEP